MSGARTGEMQPDGGTPASGLAAEEAATSPPIEALRERVAELEVAACAQERRLDGMLRIAGNLARSRDPRRAMRTIVAEISELLGADRTTIYELDRGTGMLRGLAVQGETSIEVGVPVGEGIAGLVAAKGKAINLKDAYLHPAFDPKFDKLTGYRTRSMLVVPMRNPNRDVIGVVQVLNKRDGYFTVDDENLLAALASQAAITLEALRLHVELDMSNAELQSLSEDLRQKVRELELLSAIEQAISDAHDVDALAALVLSRAAQVARAEATALFLPGETGFGPLFVNGAERASSLRTFARVEVGEGVLGKTASRGATIRLRDDDEDDEGMPRTLGGGCDIEVRDAVSAPLVEGDRTLGAFALVNRRAADKRDDDEDERLVVLIARAVARAVARLEERQSAQNRDRLMAIGGMLSGVLHDLRGPMSIMSGYSQLMATQNDPEERAKMADAIRRQVSLFNDMTREVLSFARGERSVLARKVYLRKFVQHAREMLETEFVDRGVAFEVVDESDGVAWFDEAKMLRVVANIARNARQALGNRGTFTWRIQDAPGGGVVFHLADDGPGIPEGMRHRLFEMFTTAGKEEGTGLGLAIVRRIVEDHGGTVTFTTETGKGTTFTVELPAPPARAA